MCTILPFLQYVGYIAFADRHSIYRLSLHATFAELSLSLKNYFHHLLSTSTGDNKVYVANAAATSTETQRNRFAL